MRTTLVLLCGLAVFLVLCLGVSAVDLSRKSRSRVHATTVTPLPPSAGFQRQNHLDEEDARVQNDVSPLLSSNGPLVIMDRLPKIRFLEVSETQQPAAPAAPAAPAPAPAPPAAAPAPAGQVQVQVQPPAVLQGVAPTTRTEIIIKQARDAASVWRTWRDRFQEVEKGAKAYCDSKYPINVALDSKDLQKKQKDHRRFCVQNQVSAEYKKYEAERDARRVKLTQQFSDECAKLYPNPQDQQKCVEVRVAEQHNADKEAFFNRRVDRLVDQYTKKFTQLCEKQVGKKNVAVVEECVKEQVATLRDRIIKQERENEEAQEREAKWHAEAHKLYSSAAERRMYVNEQREKFNTAKEQAKYAEQKTKVLNEARTKYALYFQQLYPNDPAKVQSEAAKQLERLYGVFAKQEMEQSAQLADIAAVKKMCAEKYLDMPPSRERCLKSSYSALRKDWKKNIHISRLPVVNSTTSAVPDSTVIEAQKNEIAKDLEAGKAALPPANSNDEHAQMLRIEQWEKREQDGDRSSTTAYRVDAQALVSAAAASISADAPTKNLTALEKAELKFTSKFKDVAAASQDNAAAWTARSNARRKLQENIKLLRSDLAKLFTEYRKYTQFDEIREFLQKNRDLENANRKAAGKPLKPAITDADVNKLLNHPPSDPKKALEEAHAAAANDAAFLEQ